MKNTKRKLPIPALLLLALAFAGCSEKTEFAGNWQSAAPDDLTASLTSAEAASATTSLMIQEGAEPAAGDLTLTTLYDITSMSPTDSVAGGVTFEAKAQAKGTWSRDVDDQDDILVAFDYSSINVDVPAAGMTPQEAGRWKMELTRVFREQLSHYSVIEDLKVEQKGNRLTLELQNPEKKMLFLRIEP